MLMERKVPDVPMLEMTHGTVEINMIPPLAHQDGLVMKHPENVLWLTQEMDLEVNQLAKITATLDQTHQAQDMMTNTDAIQPAILVINVRKETLDAALIDQALVLTVKIQIHPNFSDAIRPTQNNQNAKNAKREIQLLVACKELRPAIAAHQNKNYLNVMKRHSRA